VIDGWMEVGRHATYEDARMQMRAERRSDLEAAVVHVRGPLAWRVRVRPVQQFTEGW
jgi:hypothetical protein